MSPKENNQGTHLYRLYAEDGSLLYVGISDKWFSRMRQHASGKGWWEDVATVKREAIGTRADALAAEAKAILEERPLHNVHWRKPPRTPKPPRVRRPLPPGSDLKAVGTYYDTLEALYLRAATARKRVVVLAHQAGWSQEEIAAELGVSRARVGQLLKAAKL